MRFLLLLSFFLFVPAFAAHVNQCRLPSGDVLFTDSSCESLGGVPLQSRRSDDRRSRCISIDRENKALMHKYAGKSVSSIPRGQWKSDMARARQLNDLYWNNRCDEFLADYR